jgi:membrane protein involved in colicin uptake
MTKLRTILAGTAVAMFAQFAAAQGTAPATTVVPAASAPANPNDPAYTDQSRLNQNTDPYVKKREATAAAKKEYKAEKKAAKSEYKADKKASKQEYKDEKKDAKETRAAELRAMPPAVDPVTGKPSTASDPVVPGTSK